jgi:hypothetical protein
MNTVNALGYLVGALLLPRLLRRWPARALFLVGSGATAALLGANGMVLGETAFRCFACVSAALFGSVFLSVVASTTALVRHNADPAAWPAGIAAFTTVFAFADLGGLCGRRVRWAECQLRLLGVCIGSWRAAGVAAATAGDALSPGPVACNLAVHALAPRG